MKAVKVLVLTVFFLNLAISFAVAMPSAEEIRTFEAGLDEERRAFEQQLKATKPGERTQEIQRFNQETAQEKIAFDQSVQGMALEQKQSAFTAYQERRRVKTLELNQKLKKLPPEKANFQEQRKAFDKKIAEKMRVFYSQ